MERGRYGEREVRREGGTERGRYEEREVRREGGKERGRRQKSKQNTKRSKTKDIQYQRSALSLRSRLS